MATLSVIVLTKDEEANIDACLSSVRWADEIIVVDAGSLDRTVEHARKYTEKIFVRAWDGFGAAKNFGLTRCSGDWALWLDADERVTDALREEIQRSIATADDSVAAFSMPRKANFLGHWIMHCGWYPGRVTRLFRRTRGKFSGERVHERLIIDGTTLPLQSDILHYTDPDLFHYFEKYNSYTSLAAEELVEKGASVSWLSLLIKPWWQFVRMFFLRLGFLDGMAGYVLCRLSASYTFTKYAKLWERRQTSRRVSA